jgi:hypothetical protein
VDYLLFELYLLIVASFHQAVARAAAEKNSTNAQHYFAISFNLMA